LTSPGQALGTPDYIAPEQIKDAPTADIRADIYSLGGTLYFLLTGHPPFQEKSLYDLYQAHISRNAEPVNQVRPDVPAELAAVVAKMMAKDPVERFQTPGEVAQALKPFCTRSNAALKVVKADVSSKDPAKAAPARAEAAAAVTQLETDADRRTVPPGSSPESVTRWESMIDFGQTERELAGASDVAPRRWLPWVLSSSAVAVLIVGLLAAWMGGLFKVKTPDGVIVLENVPKDAEILVDGDKVNVTWPGLGKPLEIRAVPEQHKVEVKKEGFKTFGKVVTIKTDESVEVTVRLEPLESRKVSETNPWPEAFPLAGQSLAARGQMIAAMSPNGRRVTVVASSTELWVAAAPDAAKLFEYTVKFSKGIWIWRASFSPDGKYLAVTTANDSLTRILDAATGREERRLVGGGQTLAYSPDGTRIASAGSFSNQLIHVWDTATGAKLATVGGSHPNWIWCLAFSPDGKRLASGSGRGNGQNDGSFVGELKLWDLETGTGTTFEGHPMRINGLAFSPDGKRLASASHDKTVKVWDVATRKRLVTFDKHTEAVGTIRFSPDGRLIASCGWDLPVRVWESATGREIAELLGPGPPIDRGEVWFLQFSPKGRWIYSATGSTLKAWETPKTTEGSGNPSTPVAPSQPLTPVRNGNSIITNSIGITLVLIPAGEFSMGSPDSDKDAWSSAKPQHRVRITRPFYLGATEVTQGQYRAITGESPSYFKGSDDLPVEQVSWNDALAFCDKLSEREGLKPYYQSGGVAPSGGEGYRLPTEAEWEYACRAGTSTRFSFGDADASLGEYEWFLGNSGSKTHSVGQKRPNDWGLYDMHGNVLEWCWDRYAADYYRSSPAAAADPLGPSQAADRVIRVGCWRFGPQDCLAANRYNGSPGLRNYSVGFRVARVQPGR
jgi:formylglycine-generating enzyme required for sulfatase activity/DNA-binding beta-propeller fold protein YncE